MKNVFLINFHCGSMFSWLNVVRMKKKKNTIGFNLINFVQFPEEKKFTERESRSTESEANLN